MAKMITNFRRCRLPFQTYCRWALYREESSSSSPMSTTHTDDEMSQEVDSIRPTGWSPPTGRPAPQGVEPDIPFRVRRSRFSQLPVYTDYKSGRTRVLTKISKIDGDIIKMEEMLRAHLDVDNLRCAVDGVTGSIVLHGNHRVAVRQWLKTLGF